MLARGGADMQSSAALRLFAAIGLLAIFGLVAFLTAIEKVRSAASSKGFGKSRVLCLPPQLPHLASRSPVRGAVGADRAWNCGRVPALGLG